MQASDCYDRDNEKRAAYGWPRGAFIAPEWPEPTTWAERKAQELVAATYGARVYMMHVYDVLELVERALLLVIERNNYGGERCE